MNTLLTDILFVSNFSINLDITEADIASHLPENINYKILTYRKSDIKNSISYEDFIEQNFNEIEAFEITKLNEEFSQVNLYLAVVCERFFTNYYYGIERSLGNKELSFCEINFLIKSFVLFLSPHMREAKIVFTGYADNFISTLTYYLGKQYNKKCLAFHDVSLINNDSNYIFEGLYAKPVKNLIIHNESKNYDELVVFMKNYDGKKDIKERARKNKLIKKGIFGVFSPNFLDLKYLKFAFFGYSCDIRIKVYMNIDRPSVVLKTKANLYRLFNKFRANVYLKSLEFSPKTKEKYIYFPMQLQPEASTASRAPFFMNQLATIEILSKSLPLGFKLLVKEHPLAVGLSAIGFYKKINKISNVQMVNINYSGKKLIEISDLVVGFGGTTLFESVLMGKKILILLEDYLYSESKLIFRAFNKLDLKEDIIIALSASFSEEQKKEEKEKMLNFFYQRGFPRFTDFEKNIADNLYKVFLSDNKKILVTGANGFIGSHLTEMLVKNGYKVKALCEYNSFGSYGWLDNSPYAKDIEFVLGDVRDPHFCKTITKDVDIVFHLAALIAIPYSYIAPQSYIETNINGTLNICQGALENGCQRVIHTSTSEVYGTAKYVPIDENHPLQPQSPYSASKIGADAIAMSFYNSFNLPLTIARPFNTYGPRQSARAVIPTIITQIANGAKEVNLGDTSPTRDFNYVEDTCRGFLDLAKCDRAIGEVVNIGSNYEISIKDTLELIKKIMGSDVEFVSDKERLRPENSEVFRLWCDNSKIEKLTGFKPKFSLEEGLKKTIEWFLNKENLNRYKSEIYNV